MNVVKKEAYKIIYWQLILILGLAFFMGLANGKQSGYSTLLGGGAYWMPTFLFVWRVFTNFSSKLAKQFVVRFFTYEIAKLILSGILFVLILNYLKVNLLSLLVGFIGSIVAFWLASFAIFSSVGLKNE